MSNISFENALFDAGLTLPKLKQTVDIVAGEGQVVVLYAPTVLNLNHAFRFLRVNVGGAVTMTIPPQSSVAWPDGCQIEGVQLGEGGSVTFVAGAGVTLEWDKRWALKTAAPGAVFGLKRLAADHWLVFGALEAA